MRTVWLVLGTLLFNVGFAGERKAVRIVDGKAVIGGMTFAVQPLMEVRNLKFYDCTLEETNAQCTVVTGELWNMTPEEQIAVRIEIELWRWDSQLWKTGTAVARIERPGSKVPVFFSALSEPCYSAKAWQHNAKALHVVRLSIENAGPIVEKR